MKVIIVDDDTTSIKALEKKLEAYDEVTIAGNAGNAIKGISMVKREAPDLLFLDVELPDMSGIEFLSQIRQITPHPCKVVVYTAHSSYMLSAFRGKAFDFLQKPIDDGELQKIMQRAFTELEVTEPAAPQKKDSEKMLLYTNATDFRLVNISDVALFSYNHDQRVWEVTVAGQAEPVRLKRSINNEQLVMLDNRFIQVSQRHIININYLKEVSEGICRLYPPFDKIDNVKIGRTFRKNLTERFSTL